MGLNELSKFSSLPLPLVLAAEANDVLINLPVQPAYLISKKPFKTSVPQLVEIHAKNEVEPSLAIDSVKGIALKGGTELKPGLKDYEVMNEILEFLDVD